MHLVCIVMFFMNVAVREYLSKFLALLNIRDVVKKNILAENKHLGNSIILFFLFSSKDEK